MLDRLSLLVAPRARVRRDGALTELPVDGGRARRRGPAGAGRPGRRRRRRARVARAHARRVDPHRRERAGRAGGGRAGALGRLLRRRLRRLRASRPWAPTSFAERLAAEARGHPRGPQPAPGRHQPDPAAHRRRRWCRSPRRWSRSLWARDMPAGRGVAHRRGRARAAGPGGPGAAHEPHLRRRGRAARAARDARAAAERGGEPGVGGHALPRQDRHAHREPAAGDRRRAGRAAVSAERARADLAALAGERRRAERHHAGDRGVGAGRGAAGGRRGAVLVGAQVERRHAGGRRHDLCWARPTCSRAPGVPLDAALRGAGRRPRRPGPAGRAPGRRRRAARAATSAPRRRGAAGPRSCCAEAIRPDAADDARLPHPRGRGDACHLRRRSADRRARWRRATGVPGAEAAVAGPDLPPDGPDAGGGGRADRRSTGASPPSRSATWCGR